MPRLALDELSALARGTELAAGYTVGQYTEDVKAQAKESIAEGIRKRFSERYLVPVSKRENVRHGFTMMAIACLTIEALESFRRGWKDTSQRGQGEFAFCAFFDRHEPFAAFRGHAREFYRGVRCGILHQGETTMGWKIRRDGQLLAIDDSGRRTIDAVVFVHKLQHAVDAYCDELKSAAWRGEIWVHCRRKMETICLNCAN